MMKCADLHMHTFFSDGTHTPEELVRESREAGLYSISIADHDTVEAIEPALAEAKKFGIEFLPGIELSVEYKGQEVHILGYLFDYKNKELQQRLTILQQNRRERVHKMVAKLRSIGVDLPIDSVFDISKNATVGRLHVARAMVKEGLVSEVAVAFDKYIGEKAPAYVCNFRFTPEDAVRLIKQLGGIPIIAHPYTLNNDQLIPELVSHGIMGLEAYYPQHSSHLTQRYLELAKQYNLLVTGGSDCHGAAKPDVKIGSVKIPYELVEKLKKAKGRL
ncbi:MAG: phosphatase [Candidatus Omnitrophota bacterium]|nr:MAG: phosphatase [Candidatus Omnitrophota bacterium]